MLAGLRAQGAIFRRPYYLFVCGDTTQYGGMPMAQDAGKADVIAAQLERLAQYLEKMNVAGYVELMQRPMRLLFLNFAAGLARGLGIAIGATLIFALMLEMLRRVIMLNIPGIGEFVANIVKIVEETNGKGKF